MKWNREIEVIEELDWKNGSEAIRTMKFKRRGNIAKRHFCKCEKQFHRVMERNEIGKLGKKKTVDKNIRR
jgi:hypothetical protein